MKLSPLKKSLTLVALLVIATIVIAVLFLLPGAKNFANSNKKIVDKNSELESSRQKLAALSNAKEALKGQQTEIDTINSLWPNTEEVSNFIVQIESLAKENTVVLSNVAVAENAPAAAKAASGSTAKTSGGQANNGIKFTLELKAPYQNMVNFITGLERLARLNSENQIDFTVSTTGDISARINGTIYAK